MHRIVPYLRIALVLFGLVTALLGLHGGGLVADTLVPTPDRPPLTLARNLDEASLDVMNASVRLLGAAPGLVMIWITAPKEEP